MHEYSIADSLIELAEDAARTADLDHVDVVHLQLGALSGVVGELLSFCFDVATNGTLLQDAELRIEHIPVEIYCAVCECVLQLDDTQDLCCPLCGTPTMDVRQGREIKLVSLEQYDNETERDDHEATHTGNPQRRVGQKRPSGR